MSIFIIIVSLLLILTACEGERISKYNVTVIGFVVDDISNKPIEGAKIYINSVYKGKTGENGLYEIDYSGRYKESFTLEVRKSGYLREKDRILVRKDKQTIIRNYKLKGDDFFGMISGEIFFGNINSMNLNIEHEYSDVVVVATQKEGNTYKIKSDLADINSKGEYQINHAKVNEKLTVIGWIDNNGNGYIDNEDFFGKYNPEIRLTANNNYIETGVDIFMTPDALTIEQFSDQDQRYELVDDHYGIIKKEN